MTQPTKNKFNEAIKIWLSPILIGILGYLGSKKLDAIDDVVRQMPVIIEKQSQFRIEMDQVKTMVQYHDRLLAQNRPDPVTTRTVFIKPDEIKITRE